MRKPASDVAGIEEVSKLQTQVDNSAVGTNLLLGTNNPLVIVGGNSSNQTTNDYVLANGYNISYLASKIGTQFTISYDWSVSGSSPSGTFDSIWNNLPWVVGDNKGFTQVSSSNTSSHFSNTFSLRADSKNIATGVHFRLDNFVGTLTISNVKLEKGSVATDWTPAPEDKVNVSDMRKPASDVAGIEEVNAKQDKIVYTPADDSKVAHLSGANNFDTVPTVNNNPLLLASSLPSDLARTGQSQTFTAAQKFSSAPTVLDTSSSKGDNQVALMGDLKSVEESAWRRIDNKYITNSADGNSFQEADKFSTVLYKIDKGLSNITFLFILFPSITNTMSYFRIDFSSIAKNISFPSDFSMSSTTSDNKTFQMTIVNNQLQTETTPNSSYSCSMGANFQEKSVPYVNACYVLYDELV